MRQLYVGIMLLALPLVAQAEYAMTGAHCQDIKEQAAVTLTAYLDDTPNWQDRLRLLMDHSSKSAVTRDTLPFNFEVAYYVMRSGTMGMSNPKYPDELFEACMDRLGDLVH